MLHYCWRCKAHTRHHYDDAIVRCSECGCESWAVFEHGGEA